MKWQSKVPSGATHTHSSIHSYDLEPKHTPTLDHLMKADILRGRRRETPGRLNIHSIVELLRSCRAAACVMKVRSWASPVWSPEHLQPPSIA